MARISVAWLIISDTLADHIWERHHIDTAQVQAILTGHYVVTRNHSQAATPHLLIRHDEQNRCLTIPIAPTDDPLTWRAASAWYCNRDDVKKLERG